MFNIKEIRNQFPILQQQVNGKPLVYLDNAASSQKPISVLETWKKYYEEINANVHRGIHTLSQLATEEMENSRKKVQHFINAKHDYEVIFTRGTTESINLVAYALGNSNLFRSSLQYCSLANALRKNRRKIESNSDGRKRNPSTGFFR